MCKVSGMVVTCLAATLDVKDGKKTVIAVQPVYCFLVPLTVENLIINERFREWLSPSRSARRPSRTMIDPSLRVSCAVLTPEIF